MFWLMRLRVFDPPMPPMPTVAMLTVSLGAWKPRPSTCRGTIVTPAPAIAALRTNVLRETPSSVFSVCLSSCRGIAGSFDVASND